MHHGVYSTLFFFIHLPLRGTSRPPFGEDVRGCRHSSFSLPRNTSIHKDSIFGKNLPPSCLKMKPISPKRRGDIQPKRSRILPKKDFYFTHILGIYYPNLPSSEEIKALIMHIPFSLLREKEIQDLAYFVSL